MIFTINSKEDKFLDEIYQRSMNDLNKFFEINWKYNKPKIFLVPDRKTMLELRDNSKKLWVVGWIYGNNVFVLDRKNYEKESSHKYTDKKYESLIKHELAHCFFQILSEHKGEPDWLWEGTAIYVSGQNEFKNNKDNFKNFLSFYEKGNSTEVYDESGFAVEFLVEKYGKKKLLELIKSLKDINSEKEFNNKFKKIYGFELKYENFK
jgi:hypothetical protein